MKTNVTKKKNRRIQIQISLILVLTAILGASLCAAVIFYRNHVFVDSTPYPIDSTYLDLTDREISPEHYDTLRALLPDCEIRWSVPFQGNRYACDTRTLKINSICDEDISLLAYFPQLQTIDAVGSRDYIQLQKLQAAYPQVSVTYTVPIGGREYPQDASEISFSSLTEDEVILLDYLPRLTTINAEGCTDYPLLMILRERHPEVEFHYTVTISGEEYAEDTTTLDLGDPAVPELMVKLEYLPELETVHLTEPSGEAAELRALTKAFPNVHFLWKKTVLGQTHSSEDTEFDFSGMAITTEDVENGMAYFPNAEKVIMSNCGIDNETMAAFREKMRPEYKVVWTVIVTGQRVRTDDTVFHAAGRHVSLINEQSYDLYYCEDMIVVDVGHSKIKYIDWVKGMPNLKYLILADNWIMDITPISSCKNLVYLELFINKWLKDISPLLECTALEDLSVADTRVDLAPLAQMPWLKNLWVNNCGATAEERKLLTESLPNTHIEFDHGFTTGGGWRQLQNYFDMRDIMGLPYNTW